MPSTMTTKSKRLICYGATIFVIGLLFLDFTNAVVLESKLGIVDASEIIPGRVALIFGGGMKADGSMSDMQTARVDKGIELYRSRRVNKLMMTGDDGAVRVDEVDAMKAYAIQHGVRPNDVLIDPHGYRTYESCYRESKVYGLKEVVAVSQSFHLSRIIYFCSNFGIVTVGVPADQPPYKSGIKIIVREILARAKGWLQIEITHPVSRSLSAQ